MFWVIKIEKNFQSTFQKIFLRHLDLLLTEKEVHSQNAFIKDFNTFMYNQTLHHDRKHFGCYCLQSFSAAQLLEEHVNDCFEFNSKQMIKMTKEGETVKFKNIQEKLNHHS